MSCKSFPITTDHGKNPAIQLFGNRLFIDQSPMEFLIELLLVITSSKRISKEGTPFSAPLPDLKILRNWSEKNELYYAPKARLNLKLFAFMGASRLDSRHETHRQHYKEILEKLYENIRVVETGSESDVLRTLENLFLGFQGAGFGRTWCAQSFMPVCRGLLAGETIWNESVARKKPPENWELLFDKQQSYFSMNKHLFLARGGEVLYLQLCNALRQMHETVAQWVKKSGVQLETKEQDPVWLHEALQRELNVLLDHCPQTMTDLAEFLDSGVESKTAQDTDNEKGTKKLRYVTAVSCAEESWQEGYLFAVDILRLCTANLDVIERLQLIETACAMQVLRSLAVQSARHCPSEHQVAWPGYRLAMSAPDEGNSAVKRLSRHTAKIAEKLIYRAIRCQDVDLPDSEEQQEEVLQDEDKGKHKGRKCKKRTREDILKDTDESYGCKLFVSMAKRIGLLVPRRGAGVRFTLNERLLRLLVVTTVPVGGRLTYDRFKQIVEARHGLVFDTDGFSRASVWTDGIEQVFVGNNIDSWLQEMLEAAGLLIHLSDSCALVENPATKKGIKP